MSWPEYTGPGPSKVGVLGDSIATLDFEELSAKFTVSPYQMCGAMYSGLKTSDIVALGWPATLAASSPDHVVVVAGTNDCMVPDTDWGIGAVYAISQMLAAFPSTTKVHWVKVYANPPTPPAGCSLQAHVQGWNQALVNMQASYPNLRLVDWPSCVFYFSAMGVVMLNSDGIHPTQDGQNLLAYIIGQSVAGV